MLLTQDAPPPPSTGLKTAPYAGVTARWAGALNPFPLDETTCGIVRALLRTPGLGRVLVVRLANGQLVRVRAK